MELDNLMQQLAGLTPRAVIGRGAEHPEPPNPALAHAFFLARILRYRSHAGIDFFGQG